MEHESSNDYFTDACILDIFLAIDDPESAATFTAHADAIARPGKAPDTIATGDRIYVKMPWDVDARGKVIFRATGGTAGPDGWRPADMMPKRFCCLVLEVLDVDGDYFSYRPIRIGAPATSHPKQQELPE